MQYEGVLKKMKTECLSPIQYYLVFENDFVHLNQLLDKEIRLQILGFQCLGCGENKNIFRQGYCYDCFYKTPLTGDWIMRPELSTAHLGKEDRDLEHEKEIQLQPHVVYLANSSNVKVGVTRKTQIPTRWIDQGAHEAMEIVEAPNRYLAGVTEVALKAHIADKTNWRTMLRNEIKDENLNEIWAKLKPFVPDEAQPYLLENNSETELVFPVLQYPTKLKSLNLRKKPDYTGKLKGIKGQYLIFEDDTVFNVRNNEGHVIGITVH